MADVQVINRLENLLQQKIDYAQETESRYKKQLEVLQEEIESERRKSMADQAKIRRLEEILNQKMRLIEKNEVDTRRLTELNGEQIRALKV